MSASAPDLLSAVKRASSEISGHSGSRRAPSELPSHVSRRTRDSRDRSSYCSSSRSGRSEKGFTLQQQQEAVQNLSMNRYINALQAEAQDAVKASDHWKWKMQNDKDEEAGEIRRKKEIAQRNAYLLKSQIEENKMRRAEDRREFIEAASTHSFPLFTETFISLDEVNEYREQVKKQFRKELTDQLECINTMKNLERKADLDHAHMKARENISLMGADRGKERTRLKKQGQDMVNSWDRDLRLGHIRKAILSGKDVVRQTLGPGDIPKSGPGKH